MKGHTKHRPSLLSERFEAWLLTDGAKTIDGLEAVFADRTVPVLITILMTLPALPVPTGGISHVFEAICMVLALEQVAGSKTVRLPIRLRRARLPDRISTRGLPLVATSIRRYQRLSTTSGRALYRRTFHYDVVHRVAALLLFLIIFSAFIAPPFSGLDTISAVAALLIAMGMSIEDGWVLLLGLVIGVCGMALVFYFGAAILSSVRRFL